MCGIGGVVFHDGRPAAESALTGLLHSQTHRGPDGQGVWTAPGVGFAHNRLAIIDVVSGAQPMVTEDGRLAIVYNGELYNFREIRSELARLGHEFRTQSDTEVALKAYAQWGVDCLERFRGMFGLAIYDRSNRTLFLARDRLGIKPLVYCLDQEFTAFASELQALMALPQMPRELDYGALDLFLHYQYVPPPFTIFKKVRKLPPGHYLLISPEEPEPVPVCYWDVRFEPDNRLSEAEWLEILDHEISESVRLHLVSDVPFGAFLSGGIDSSVVVNHMSRHLDEPVKTFTIGFEEESYDERSYAQQVADHVGSDHHLEVVRPEGLELLNDLLFRLARHYGEPFADSSAVPTYFVSRLARRHVTMVLSGDGGDELFAGYNTYPNILNAVTARPGRWRKLMRLLGRDDAGGLLERCREAPSEEAIRFYGVYYAYFQDEMRAGLYRPETAELVQEGDLSDLYPDIFFGCGAKECLAALQYLDLKTYLCGDILTKVDIASMMNSLEVRVPLLDHKVVELAARVPARLKLFTGKDGTLFQKYLLKKHAQSLYPPNTFERPKRGFGVPIDSWFGGALYEEVKARLMREDGLLHRLFEIERLRELMASPQVARNNSARIWALLALQAWADTFEITV